MITTLLKDYLLRHRMSCFPLLRHWFFTNVFGELGEKTRFSSIELLVGASNIFIGKQCFFDNYLYLSAWKSYEGVHFNPLLKIGNNCSFGAFNHISCINKITIGDNCLTGKWVTITDNSHGSNIYSELTIPPCKRMLSSKGAVIIGNNVWIGDKATILPGVTIGNNSIIAANAVIVKDVPSNVVVGGDPAEIIKLIT